MADNSWKDNLEEHTKEITVKNGLQLKTLIFKDEYEDEVNSIRRVSFGKRNVKTTKTIIFVGATGAGKSSLLSSLVNILLGVNYDDKFRIKILDIDCENKSSEVSQTDWITVYEFNHIPGMAIDYNLTIIDTPGLNDTRGLNFDKEMFKRLEMTLRNKKIGIEELHCIGIVTPSSTNRLTAGQKYVYDGCMRIFGNNIKKIIHVMATFADDSEPAILDGLKKAGVKFVGVHSFNNSSIFLNNTSKKKREAMLNKAHWETVEETIDEFLEELKSTDGRSLTQTTETLATRRFLQKKLKEVQKDFLDNLIQAQKLKTTKSSSQDQASVKLTDLAPRKTDNKTKALHCSECKVTCHDPCYGIDKCKNCIELSKKGSRCKCGCPYDTHYKNKFRYVNDQRMENMRELIGSLKELKDCVEKLISVALKPIPLSIEEYVENLLREKEDMEKAANKEQIDILIRLKEEEKKMQEVLTNEDELENMIRRMDLVSEVEKGVKTGSCCLM